MNAVSTPPDHSEERQLIIDCLKRERRAQSELYRRYYATVRGICRRYATQDSQVSALVNETYNTAFKSLPQYKGEGPFAAWLRRIAVTTCIDELRRTKAIHRKVVYTEPPPGNALVSPAALDKLALTDLVRIIQRLPATPRTVFNLHIVEGYSHAEIAKQLGLTSANSRYYLRRARFLLQSFLTQENY